MSEDQDRRTVSSRGRVTAWDAEVGRGMLAGQEIPGGCEFHRADVDQDRQPLVGELVSFVAKGHQHAWHAKSVALSADPNGDVARLRRRRQWLIHQVVMMDDDD